MARFNPNPTLAQGGIVNLPKDSYTFEVGEAKAFQNKDKDKHGVRIEMTVISDGPSKGKKIYPAFYLHNEGSQNMAKSFQLAVHGFSPKTENDWNDKYGMKDWGYDPEDKSVGNGWSELKGLLVSADLDVTVGKTADAEFQSYKWRPYNP